MITNIFVNTNIVKCYFMPLVVFWKALNITSIPHAFAGKNNADPHPFGRTLSIRHTYFPIIDTAFKCASSELEI